jgi:hypothetical protein
MLSPASFTVNIDTLSTSSVANNINAGLNITNPGLNAGLVTGTFSGTLYQDELKHITITNGKFRAIRFN